MTELDVLTERSILPDRRTGFEDNMINSYEGNLAWNSISIDAMLFFFFHGKTFRPLSYPLQLRTERGGVDGDLFLSEDNSMMANAVVLIIVCAIFIL